MYNLYGYVTGDMDIRVVGYSHDKISPLKYLRDVGYFIRYPTPLQGMYISIKL